jgi:hypothetical protein
MHANELRPGDAIVLDSQIRIIRSAKIKAGNVVAEFYNGELRTFPRDTEITDTADHGIG